MEKKQEQEKRSESLMPFDSLLECIFLVATAFGSQQSKQALIAGLPLVDHKLTPTLLIRAAKRANIQASVVKQGISKLSFLHIPAILLLKDKKACILKEVTTDGAIVIFPESPNSAAKLTTAELKKIYDGEAIVLYPMYEFKTAAEHLIKVKKNKLREIILTNWPLYSEVFLATLLINCFALATPFFIMGVYDRIIPNNAFETLWTLSIGILVIFLADFLLRAVRAYFIDTGSVYTDIEVLASVFEHILDIKLGARPPTNTLANALTSYETYKDFLGSTMIVTAVDIPFIILFLVVIFLIGGWIVAIPLITIPLVFLVSLINQRKLNRLSYQSIRFNAEKIAIINEGLENIENIKVNQAESELQRQWELLTYNVELYTAKIRFYVNFGMNFSIFMQYFTTVAVIIAGVYRISEGDLTLGGLIACSILIGRAILPIIQVSSILSRFKHFRIGLELLETTLQLPTERPPNKSFLHKSTFEGDIEFRDVSFHYPKQPIQAVNQLSFQIRAKEHVGIIGLMGSGKSTVEKLILKLYEPDKGSILIDNLDINQVDPADLRRNIGYVQQDVSLFNDTIKKNITIGASYVDDDRILEVAAISGVNTFVNVHPDGYERKVGERGKDLSGGQRQSIAIARCLLLDPPILILDEPTNFLDENMSMFFIEKMKKLIANKTLILVTHKVNLLQLVDRLIVLHEGRKIADGPKEEILKKLSLKI